MILKSALGEQEKKTLALFQRMKRHPPPPHPRPPAGPIALVHPVPRLPPQEPREPSWVCVSPSQMLPWNCIFDEQICQPSLHDGPGTGAGGLSPSEKSGPVAWLPQPVPGTLAPVSRILLVFVNQHSH